MQSYAGTGAIGGPERTNLHYHAFPGGHSDLVKKVATVSAWVKMRTQSGKPQATLEALVTNVGSGHKMPTGLPGMREMWLEIVVQHPESSKTTTNQVAIGINALDADGNPTMPWNAVRFGKDTRIDPKGHRQWDFPLADTSQGTLEIRVTLYYRLVSELAARAAGIAPSPPQEIAFDSLRVYPDGRVEKTLPN